MNTKPESISVMIACLAAGLGSLLLMGCQSATSTSSASPTTPTTAPPDSGRTLPDGMAAEASAETVRHFNFVVKATGDAPANAVRQAVEGRLAAAGYKLNADAPDILVQIAVRSSEFDRSGGYLRYEGTSEAGVNRSWDNKRLGFDTVSVRGKRGLGADEAMRNLTSELSEGTAALVMNFARPEQSGLTAVDITVKRPWLKTHDPEYAQQFIRTVKQQPGVVYCALVPHDYDTKTLTFRIVHLADAMPEGVLNRLVSQRELGLKPRN